MFLVTLDGPMASGKTSISSALAKKIGWKWLSTGAFYRGFAHIARVECINVEDEDQITKLISKASWKVEMFEECTKFLYKGKDITKELYDEEVGQLSSYISRYSKLREQLIQIQRNFVKKADSKGVIVEGRDCGSVLFPEAQVKFYITAFRDIRIQRRILDEEKRKKQGQFVTQKGSGKQNSKLSKEKQKNKEANNEINEKKLFYYRDVQDSSRSIAPLKIPRQAYFVNTSDMNLEEVVQYVFRIVSKHFDLT